MKGLKSNYRRRIAPEISREELNKAMVEFKKKGGKIKKGPKLDIEEERSITKLLEHTQ